MYSQSAVNSFPTQRLSSCLVSGPEALFQDLRRDEIHG